MYINGTWRNTNKKVNVFDPATGENIFNLNKGEKKDIEDAVQSANEAFKSWSQTSALKRSDFLVDVYKKMEEKKNC